MQITEVVNELAPHVGNGVNVNNLNNVNIPSHPSGAPSGAANDEASPELSSK